MKKYLGISLTVIFALFLRILFINKPEGLWNDEYVSYMIAATPFAHGFFDAVKSQCHMPFYYLYLKFFMSVFGQSDIVLRLTSVFGGILGVIAMYFVGLEKDKRTAYFCAGFTAISSFAIYYSQEVRLYSILFFFSAMTLLYTLKTIKNPDKKNLILCGLFNFLILFTHTIGFVFVFFNLIFLSANLYKQYKNIIIKFWSAIIFGGIILSPLAFKILTARTFSQWWGHFSISKIGFLFTDYFSPVLTNLTNAPDKFIYAPKLAFFMLIPTLIAITFIIISLIKEKLNRQLFCVCAATVIVMVLASISGKLVFITKYSIEIYPVLIFLACQGCNAINNKIIRNTLIAAYCVISLGYILFYPNSAPKMRHAEGHKIVADSLKELGIKKGDVILFEYYSHNRFEKYFDFSPYKTVSINKGNFNEYLSADTSYEDAYKNGKEIYKSMFMMNSNPHFESMLANQILNNLKQGQSVFIVILNSVSFYSPQAVQAISRNENAYKKCPLLFLIFSYVKNKTFYDIMNELDISGVKREGSWTLIKFTKLKI